MKKASTKNMVEMTTVKPEPPSQGEYRIDARTVIKIPAHVTDIEAWKARMNTKYMGYERRNELARLTVSAMNHVKEQI
jgi:hypothetical protein